MRERTTVEVNAAFHGLHAALLAGAWPPAVEWKAACDGYCALFGWNVCGRHIVALASTPFGSLNVSRGSTRSDYARGPTL